MSEWKFESKTLKVAAAQALEDTRPLREALMKNTLTSARKPMTDIKQALDNAKRAPRIPGVRCPYPTVTLLASDVDALWRAVVEARAMLAALRRIANAADDVGVQFFDTDTMDPIVSAMQEATEFARAAIAAAEAAGITTE